MIVVCERNVINARSPSRALRVIRLQKLCGDLISKSSCVLFIRFALAQWSKALKQHSPVEIPVQLQFTLEFWTCPWSLIGSYKNLNTTLLKKVYSNGQILSLVLSSIGARFLFQMGLKFKNIELKSFSNTFYREKKYFEKVVLLTLYQPWEYR